MISCEECPLGLVAEIGASFCYTGTNLQIFIFSMCVA